MIHLLPSRPIAIELFGFDVHWYGILYLVSFVIAAILLPRLQHWRGLQLTEKEWERILNASILGVILGGRLGYVLFYHLDYFITNPVKIFAVWEGGMSFHGGLIGVVLGLWWAMRGWSAEKIWRVADIAVVPSAIGLALGRIGNFINFELFGPLTELPWGMAVPGVEGFYHPTPLYECAYSLVIALSCYWVLRKSVVVGRSFGVFLLLYGIFRFCTEFVRTPDAPLTELAGLAFTRGQVLTVPVFLAGCVVLWWTARRVQTSGGGGHMDPTV